MIQAELALIPHEIESFKIDQRAMDGYINATVMCKAAGKQINSYTRLETTAAYLKALSSETRIPVSDLIQHIRGGSPSLQGTWVHPRVAIHQAQWLSPRFAVLVSGWVFEWLSGGNPRGLPDHVRRYMLNRPKIPPTHFSMLDQMTLRLLAPLEDQGYMLPADLMPDISLGRMFSEWLRDQGYDPNTFPVYNHEFLDHRPIVQARLYPNELMTNFNQQLERWLSDGRAQRYFGARDPDSIEPLDSVLSLLSP